MEVELYLTTMTLTILWRALLPAESPSLLRRWFTLPCPIFWSCGGGTIANADDLTSDHPLQYLYLRKVLGHWSMNNGNVKTSSKSLCCANCLWVVATHCSKYSNLSTKFAKWHTVEKPQADVPQQSSAKVNCNSRGESYWGFENLEKTHLCNCSSFMPLTSPASLLIMSSGMLRSTWRRELSKAL